ncbi:IclR family transcriptional regulator [Nocardioides sp. cx-169]|uniref:IclR family transcriptional regulator n=1 Tax=Nocardioides sp. cx-169 TaxID=2899080 RepID=UPI001E4B7D0A|nr:IclR family transcriptional regulator [Nocardioides sp. cx-169]MCD4534279.1 IclR family transcriptional regulator [Nocardioides sp. cx-169]
MVAVTPELDAKRSVLGRAFDILDCFVGPEPEQTISTLCDQTGLPPATVHRMLATLSEWGAIERAGRGRYRLGMRLWRLGWGVPGARQVRDVARPYMVDLYSATQEIVVLGSRDGNDVLLVDQIAGRSCGSAWESTRRFPMGSIAPGLVHLAHMPVPEMRGLVADGHVKLPRALAEKEFLLLQTLAEIRAHGLAVTRGRPGGRAWISAPIYDSGGELRSTLSVVVPEERLALAPVTQLVRQAARAVSHGLGARTRPGRPSVTPIRRQSDAS